MTRAVVLSADTAHKARRLVAVIALAITLGGCLFAKSYQRGYVLDEAALEQVPAGASQEQVLLVLGTPSTVATVQGEVFYYISQKTEQSAAFMKPQVTDQRVLAVYFNDDRRVERIANYGMKDGKIFDFISRTTTTGGMELNLVRQIFRAIQF
jgi:outer membrane protein assembly factor BamE (lipoprotein component of BamABCDE complex)